MKYERLLKTFQDNPDVYRKHRDEALERQRRYANDPVYREKHRLACIKWKEKKARGLPTRPRVKRGANGGPLPVNSDNMASPNFDFTLVPQISVSFD